jgi:hypothetical protein
VPSCHPTKAGLRWGGSPTCESGSAYLGAAGQRLTFVLHQVGVARQPELYSSGVLSSGSMRANYRSRGRDGVEGLRQPVGGPMIDGCSAVFERGA